MQDRYISLAHGNGGRYMRELISEVFANQLGGDGALDVSLDAAPMRLDPAFVPCMTTDGFIVQPLEFPGGNIGSLAPPQTLALSEQHFRVYPQAPVINDNTEGESVQG